MTEPSAESYWKQLEKYHRYNRDERSEIPDFDYVDKLGEYITELDDHWEIESPKGSVLRWDKIREYSQNDNYRMIRPFDEKHLKAASYQLTVGDKYDMNDKEQNLSREGYIEIEPFNVVVIRTREVINMPRNLIGRWNIKVSKAYDGLLWVGGPQVDPGFAGHLFCPIYNMSNEKRELEFGEEIAVLDFIKTSEYTSPNTDFDMERPKSEGLSMDKYRGLESGLISEAADKIANNEDAIEDLQSDLGTVQERSVRYLSYILTILIVVITSVSVVVTAAGSTPTFAQNIPEILTVMGGVLGFVAFPVAIYAVILLRGN